MQSSMFVHFVLICAMVKFGGIVYYCPICSTLNNVFHEYQHTPDLTITSNNSQDDEKGANTDNAKYPQNISLYDLKNIGIKTIYVENFSEEVLDNIYRFRTPVVIKFHNGASDWINVITWSLKSLEQDDRVTVMRGKSRDIVRHGGSGNDEVKLSDYLQDIGGVNGSYGIVDADKLAREDTEEPSYVFDRSFCSHLDHLESLKLPTYIPYKNSECILILGTANTGITFHHHADAWNAVISGKKRWFFYPLTFTPPGGVHHGYSHLEWLNHVYTNLTEEQKPVEYIQESGEIMYIPESMYHSTINLETTLALGFQLSHAQTDLEDIFYQYKVFERVDEDRNLDVLYDQLSNLRVMFPDNTEIMLKMSTLLLVMDRLPEAASLLEDAMKMDPHFVVALLDLCRIYEEMLDVDKAESCLKRVMVMSPTLWDGYAFCGDFYMRQDLPRLAVECYKKGTELQPEMTHFWTMLNQAQEAVHDLQNANY